MGRFKNDLRTNAFLCNVASHSHSNICLLGYSAVVYLRVAALIHQRRALLPVCDEMFTSGAANSSEEEVQEAGQHGSQHYCLNNVEDFIKFIQNSPKHQA